MSFFCKTYNSLSCLPKCKYVPIFSMWNASPLPPSRKAISGPSLIVAGRLGKEGREKNVRQFTDGVQSVTSRSREFPFPGICHFIWWYRNRYRKNLVPEKSTGIGIGKIWYWKKVSEPVSEKLGTGKSIGTGTRKKINIKKGFVFLSNLVSWYSFIMCRIRFSEQVGTDQTRKWKSRNKTFTLNIMKMKN